MRQYWDAPLPPVALASGAAFASFTAIQDISPKPDKKFPANFLEPGTRLRLYASGNFSTTGTPTLSLAFYLGTTAVPIGQSSAITTGSGAAAWPWILEYEGTVRVASATGTLFGQGRLSLGTSLTAMSITPVPISAALRTTTIDTSIEKIIGVAAAWSASAAGNSITVDEFSVLVNG